MGLRNKISETDLRSLQFRKGTAFDRPNQGFSREPFIGKFVDIPAPDKDPSKVLGFIDSATDGLVRGGILTAIKRSALDVGRITQFLLTTRGLGFITKQIGLQLSNPRIPAGSAEFEVFGKKLEFSHNRTYNLGINTLAQTLVNFSGIHLDRAGVLPIWPESEKYERLVRNRDNFFNGKPMLGKLDPNKGIEGGSRLLTLHAHHIVGSLESEKTPEEEEKPGFLEKLGSKIKRITGKDDPILFEYNGGPNSTYGIGKTSIRRATKTIRGNNTILFDDKWPSENYQTFNLQGGVQNFIKILNDNGAGIAGGFDYQGDAKGGRKYYIESRIGTGHPGTRAPYNGSRIDIDPHIRRGQELTDNKYVYNVYDPEKVDKINMLDVFNTVGNLNTPGVRDLIRFRFEAVNTNNPQKSDVMVFRAFLDGYSDNFNASHNEFQYNGRGESFYTYSGFSRDINVQFKIAAQTRHEMMPLYRKLNYLASNTAPEYMDSGRMATPFMKVTVGALLDRVPGVISNVQITWKTDYPWEIAIDSPEGGQDAHMLVLPHILDVSVNFKPVHNFLPKKDIHSPFILPHPSNRILKKEQKWYEPNIAKNLDEANKLGIDRLIPNVENYMDVGSQDIKGGPGPYRS